MSARKISEWIVRTLAIAALFLAFKPGDAMAAASTDDTDSINTTSVDGTIMAAADIDIDVDQEEEVPALSE